MLGIDLGGTKIAYAVVVPGTSTIVARHVTETRSHEGAPAVLQRMIADCRDVCAAAGITPSALTGIGIGVPGVFDDTTGMVTQLDAPDDHPRTIAARLVSYLGTHADASRFFTDSGVQWIRRQFIRRLWQLSGAARDENVQRLAGRVAAAVDVDSTVSVNVSRVYEDAIQLHEAILSTGFRLIGTQKLPRRPVDMRAVPSAKTPAVSVGDFDAGMPAYSSDWQQVGSQTDARIAQKSAGAGGGRDVDGSRVHRVSARRGDGRMRALARSAEDAAVDGDLYAREDDVLADYTTSDRIDDWMHGITLSDREMYERELSDRTRRATGLISDFVDDSMHTISRPSENVFGKRTQRMQPDDAPVGVRMYALADSSYDPSTDAVYRDVVDASGSNVTKTPKSSVPRPAGRTTSVYTQVPAAVPMFNSREAWLRDTANDLDTDGVA